MSLPTRFVARPSPARLTLLVLGSLAFVVLGAWVAGWLGPAPRPGREWIGWAAMLFFGLGAIVGVRRLFDQDDQIVVDGSGLYWKQWSEQTIPWSEVTDIREREIRRQRFLCLYLRNPERFPSGSAFSRMIRASNAMADFGDISLSPIGTDKSFTELKDAILAYWRPPLDQRG